jgi:hypothetical protein
MTTLESIIEMISNRNETSAKKRHLYLAYLMLHMENPCLHPDEYLSDQGGYEGYMPILVHTVLSTGTGNFPDNFFYPCAFLKIEGTLEELELFYSDQVEDALESDKAAENNLLAAVHTLQFFITEMKGTELDEAVQCLTELYLYHAHENDTAEEESDKPAGILKDCADVLNWIQQFAN